MVDLALKELFKFNITNKCITMTPINHIRLDFDFSHILSDLRHTICNDHQLIWEIQVFIEMKGYFSKADAVGFDNDSWNVLLKEARIEFMEEADLVTFKMKYL